MGILSDLASGKLGLIVVPPDQLVLKEETARSATFGAGQGEGWWLHFFPGIHLDLDPAHDAELARDLERHTRALFDSMYAFFAANEAAQGERPAFERGPRTADPTWSPLIEHARFAVEGGPALTVLHRMIYQPGSEAVMGHTLVPVADGLFEARWLMHARETGFRESMLLVQQPPGEDGAPQMLSQRAMDDPAHDASFPMHPLSLARAARSWHADKICVTKPAPRSLTGARVIDGLGCTIAPPPRFVLVGVGARGERTTAEFTRVAFSGAEGVEAFCVSRSAERIRGIAVGTRMLRNARAIAPAWFAAEGYANIVCDARLADGDAPSVAVSLEGTRPPQAGQSRGRAAGRLVRDAGGYLWWIAIATTVAVPVAELTAELDAAVRSWRAS